MSASLKRRLATIEAAVFPKADRDARILVEPSLDAPAEAWEVHRRAVADAKAAGARVLLVCRSRERAAEVCEPGIEAFDTELEAQLALLAGQRSEKGNRDRLADVLQGLTGRVMGGVGGAGRHGGVTEHG